MCTPIHVPQDNQQSMDSAPDESPFQQVIPSILQQSLYPSLSAMGTSVNTVVSPSVPFTRKVINDIEEQQRKTLKDTVEGNNRHILPLFPMKKERKRKLSHQAPIYKLVQLKQIAKRKLRNQSLQK